MVKTLTKFVIIAAVCAGGYFLLNHHIVFFGRTLKVLKKYDGMTFNNTFVNGNIDAYHGAEDLLRDEQLRRGGIGHLLVQMGKISQEELDQIERRIDSGAPPTKSDIFGK